MTTSIAILAGGKSQRMGQDKAFMRLGQHLVIERVLAQVAELSDDLMISTNSPDQYAAFGPRLVPDVYPDSATLGGIYSVIQAARHSHVLVVACDMPLLNRALIEYLISLGPQADVIAPLIAPPQPETTHTVYSKACLPAIECRMQSRKLRIIGFFEDVNVHYVPRTTVEEYDPACHSFINMNTPQEFARIEALIANSSEA